MSVTQNLKCNSWRFHITVARRILIVEDEPFIAENLQEMLSIFGHENTEIANSTSQAIKAIKISRPDLVFLDIKIKGDQDGIELGGIIKEQYQLPFVYLTSYSDKETVNRAKHTQPFRLYRQALYKR